MSVGNPCLAETEKNTDRTQTMLVCMQIMSSQDTRMITHSLAMRSHVELHVADVYGRVLASGAASPKLFD